MSKVNFIIPVYNVEDYLDICLDSILAQSFKDFEVICVNDGSTDSSLYILEKYAKFDKRIKVYDKKHGGVSASRNFGMTKVNSPYTMFVDSDDYISHVMLERLLNNIVQYDSDFSFCNAYTFNNITYKFIKWEFFDIKELDKYVNKPVFNEASLPSEFMFKIPGESWGKLYKTEFIKNFTFPVDKIFEDCPFFAECYLNAKRISFDPPQLYFYRNSRQNSILTSDLDKLPDIFEMAHMVKNILIKNGKYEKYCVDYILKYFKLFHYTIMQANDKNIKNIYKLIKNEIEQIDLNLFDMEKIKKYKQFNYIYRYKDMDLGQFVNAVSLLKKNGGKI